MASSATSLVLSTTTTAGKSETMSVSDINPQANNQQIIDFTNALMNLSTNSLVSISKVTKEEVFKNG